MNNLHTAVLNEMLLLKGYSMFTVYDIRRILEHRSGEKLSHDEVRSWVELYYKQAGLRRDIGYHLPYSPPPQVYHIKGQDINKYNADALDPSKPKTIEQVIQDSTMPAAKPHTVKVIAIPVHTEYWYALVNKKTGQRVTPSDPKRRSNQTGLYRNRKGPSQLRINGNPNDYEIVKYEVILKEVTK